MLMMLFLMVTAWLVARKRGYVMTDMRKPSAAEFGRAAWGAKWALLFPVLLIGTIRGGLFTPSEVCAFAVVYAILIGRVAHGDMTFEAIKRAFAHALSDIGLIMLIILMSGMIGFAIIFLQVPQDVAHFMLENLSNPILIVTVILIGLFIAGLFFESTILVLLLTPILVPVVTKAGVDPVHFGILMMTIVTFGSMTPPVGVAMFTVCSLLDTRIEEYVKEAMPFIAAIIALIALLLFVPEIVLFLPNLTYGG